MSYNTIDEDEGFECVRTCISYIIVPHDTDKACVGPLRSGGGNDDVRRIRAYALEALGMKEREYDLRTTHEVNADAYEGHPQGGH